MERFLRPLPLLGLAFAVRAALALWTSTLAADGAYHLATAQGFLDGRFGELLGEWRMHPLNPILTGLCGAVLGGVEAGGAAVGTILSSLALLPLYALARRFWNEQVAGWAGLLYALHPTLVHEGSEVLNTGAYLFFFFSALTAGVAALDTRKPLLFALAGLACGLLYLVRPEGLLIPFFLVLMAAGRLRKAPRGRLLAGAALAGAVGLLVAAPYLLWLRSHVGRWVLTDRSSVRLLVGELSEAAGTRTPIAYKIYKTCLKSQYPLLVPLLVLGLLRHRRSGGPTTALAWAGALSAATLAPSILLLLKTGIIPPSHRYFLPAVCLFLPWTASGLLFLKTAARGWGWAPVALVLAVLLAKDVGPRRPEEATLRRAGAWIRGLSPPPEAPLLTRSEKIAWYAGMSPRPIRFHEHPDALAATLEARRGSGARYLALDGPTLERYARPGFEAALLEAGFERIAAFEGKGLDPVLVFQWKGAR